jgi:hypothetical protein
MQTLTTEELHAGNGALYVINTSDQARKSRDSGGGDVMISVKHGDVSRIIRVPKTWVPVEVTKTVPRKILVEAAYFLEAVAAGLITPVATKDAIEVLRSDRAQEELERMEQHETAVEAEMRSKGISKNTYVTGGREEEEEEKPVKQPKRGISVVDFDSPEAVKVSFIAWTNKINALTEKEALNELRRRGSVEQEEAVYLIDNCKHKKICAGLKKSLGM